MCLAIPGQIIAIDATPDGPVARVDYGITTRSARLLFLPDARVGDFVIVQAGFATTVVPEAEAREALAYARETDLASARASV